MKDPTRILQTYSPNEMKEEIMDILNSKHLEEVFKNDLFALDVIKEIKLFMKNKTDEQAYFVSVAYERWVDESEEVKKVISDKTKSKNNIADMRHLWSLVEYLAEKCKMSWKFDHNNKTFLF